MTGGTSGRVIYVGIDDTDTLETRGTNQLARALARRASPWFHSLQIVRHQLLLDPRVPYTSKNGSASLLFEPRVDGTAEQLVEILRAGMQEDFIPGSDPGLCVADQVTAEVVEFSRACQNRIVTQEEARVTARLARVYLEGLGGTHQGIIGALAAIGLAHTGQDGRVVQWGAWPDDLAGPTTLAAIRAREVRVFDVDDQRELLDELDLIDVGKHLRPNLREHACWLFVERVHEASRDMRQVGWRAQKRV